MLTNHPTCKHCGIILKIAARNINALEHALDCPIYWHDASEAIVTLRLNKYEAANLLCALEHVLENPNNFPSCSFIHNVRYQLQTRMCTAGKEFTEHKPSKIYK